jgi:hypothetical protein
LKLPFELRHVLSEAEWATLVPERKPEDGVTDKDVLGNTIVTGDSIGLLHLPAGYKLRTARECLDGDGLPVASLDANPRFVAAGMCEVKPAFVIAARAGILDVRREQSLTDRLQQIDRTANLGPLADLLDRIAQTDPDLNETNLNAEGRPGLLVAAWFMMRDPKLQDGDWLSWAVGVERCRFLLRQFVAPEILEAAKVWEENRLHAMEVMRQTHRRKSDPPAQDDQGESQS